MQWVSILFKGRTVPVRNQWPALFGIGSFPLVGQFLNGARFGHGPQGVQGIKNDAFLAFHVSRFTKHTTPCKFYKQGPRRLDVGHPIWRIAHGDGGNPCLLCHPLNQTHGLMTFRSDRHQEKDVNPFGPDPGKEFWDRPCNQCHHVVDITEAVMDFRHLTDDIFLFQFDKTVDGKDNINVLLRQAVVVMGVGNSEFFLKDGFGDLPKGGVTMD